MQDKVWMWKKYAKIKYDKNGIIESMTLDKDAPQEAVDNYNEWKKAKEGLRKRDAKW